MSARPNSEAVTAPHAVVDLADALVARFEADPMSIPKPAVVPLLQYLASRERMVQADQCAAEAQASYTNAHAVKNQRRTALLTAMREAEARDPNRCAVCGWPLDAIRETGCVRGNCSQRPRPDRLYDAERAESERAR